MVNIFTSVYLRTIAVSMAWEERAKLITEVMSSGWLCRQVRIGLTGDNARFVGHREAIQIYIQKNTRVASGERASDGGKIAVRFAGARDNLKIEGDIHLGLKNYYLGRDLNHWHAGIPTFARVRYRDVYPGVDVLFYARNGRLEFDFQIAPQVLPASWGLARVFGAYGDVVTDEMAQANSKVARMALSRAN